MGLLGGGLLEDHALLFVPGPEIRQAVLLAEFPLAILQVFPIPVGRSPVAAADANIVELHMDPALGLAVHDPAIRHFDMFLALLTYDAFRIFDLLHGTAPRQQN